MKKPNTLYQLYLYVSGQHRKFTNRLNKNIASGNFYDKSLSKQRQTINRINKFRNRLNSLYFKLAMAGVSGFILNGVTPTDTKAQGLGPFTSVNRIQNPLRAPLQIYSSNIVGHALGDIDQDGDLDLIVSYYDGDGYIRTFKNFQVEYGSPKPVFMEVPNGALPFTISNDDASFVASFIDLDGDGLEELAIAVGYYQPVEFLQNDNDGTGNFSLISPAGIYIDADYYTSNMVSVDIDNDGDLDIITGSTWSSSGLYFWENDGANNFALTPHSLSGGPIDYGTPAFFDIDNDGDQDIFMGDDSGVVHFFLNQESGGSNINPDNFIQADANPLNFLAGTDFGSYTLPLFVDLDMDGDQDLVLSKISGGGSNKGYLHVFYNDGSNNFTEATGLNNPFGGVDVGDLADPAWADIDGDNDLDLFVGSKDNWIYFYENQQEIYGFTKFIRRIGASNPLDFNPGINDASPQFGDLDEDGDNDLYVGTNDSGLFYFYNSGTPSAATFEPNDPTNSLITELSTTPHYQLLKPTLGDIDMDGDLDAMIGTGYSNGGGGESVYYMINTGNPTPPLFSKGSEASTYLNYHDLQLVDLDHDGDADLVVGSNFSDVRFFENNGSGFTEITGVSNPFDGMYSFISFPSFMDVDDDGDLDLFLGDKYGNIELAINNNIPPTLAIDATPIDFDENDPPTQIDALMLLSDDDATPNVHISEVIITIGNYTPGEDFLSFTDHPNINEDFTAGVLTLRGNAIFTDYQTLLQSVTFQNTSEDPNTTPRDIIIEVRDSDFTDPVPVQKTINVISINDPPELTIGSSSITFTEDGSAVNVDGIFFVIDDDDANLVGATISIAAHVPGQDEFLFTTQNGISGLYDDVNGVMTLSGSSSVANYQAAMRTLQFNNTSEDPTAGIRTISIVMNDGTDLSAGVTQTIDVVAVNDDPILAGGSSIIDYNPGSGTIQLGSPLFAISDVDDTNMSGGDFTIIGGYVNGDDVLTFVDGGTVIGNFTAGSGNMSLSGTFTNSQYEVAMNSVFYENLNPTPDHIDRVIDILVRDATGGISTTFTTTVALPPVLTLDGSTLTFQEDVSGPVLIDPAFAITDDQATIEEATITIGSFVTGEDALNFTTQNGISGSFSSGVLTLTGTTTLANYETAIRSIEYENTSEDPNITARTIDINVSPLAGTLTSVTYSRPLTVQATNDAPVLSLIGGPLTYTVGSGPIVIDATTSVTDVDNTSLSSAQVVINSGLTPGDVLSFTLQGSVLGSFNAVSGILNLSGVGTLAEYEAILRSVTFENLASPGVTPREILFSVDDGTDGSNIVGRTININIPNSIPLVNLTSTDLAYNENDGPVVVDPGTTVTDDTPQLVSATISISSNYQLGEDILNFIDQNGITGSFDSGLGVLSLSGSADVVFYESALASVTYENTSENPDISPRTITFIVNDGIDASSPNSRIIQVTAINDAPLLVGSSGDISYRSLTGSIIIDDLISLSDVDDTDLVGATISISSGYSSGEDLLLFTDQNGIIGSFNSVTGVLSMSGSASLSAYQTALASVEYENTANAPSTATKQIDFVVSDISLSSNTSSRTIQVASNVINAANLDMNAPIGVSTAFDVVGAATFTPGDILTTTILAGPSQGVASVQADGSILYNPAIDANGSDVISYELCNEFASCGSGTINITIDNEAPVIESVTANVEPGGIATISLSDLISDANNNVDPNSIVVISNDSGVPITIDSDLNLIVNYTNSDFIDRVDHIIIRVCDFSGLCTQQEIKIAVGDINKVLVFNAVTPNNDGRHDFLKIQDIEFFPNNEMFIYNKIGSLVYNAQGYDNVTLVFDGQDNDGNELPDGTYYYVIILDEDNKQSGFFVLQR